MSSLTIATSKKCDGTVDVAINGDDKVLEKLDILAITKEVLRPTTDESEIAMETIMKIEERQKAQDAKIEKLDERLDRMDEKLDRLFKKLDDFAKTDPNRLRDIPTVPNVPNIPGWTYTGIDGVNCGGFGHGPWDTAPDEETRKRIWEYWHNPDGTPKIVSGVAPEKPEMTMGGAPSYFGLDVGVKDTTVQTTLDGDGNVISATEQTSPCSALNPMA